MVIRDHTHHCGVKPQCLQIDDVDLLVTDPFDQRPILPKKIPDQPAVLPLVGQTKISDLGPLGRGRLRG